MKGLVVQNPWAWCIARAEVDPAAKLVENRSWAPGHDGSHIAIIAGRTVDRDALDHPQVAATISRWLGAAAGTWVGVMPWEQGPGAVIAVARYVGVCLPSDTGRDCSCGPWAVPGQLHWDLCDVRALAEPVPVRGRLGLFDLPADVEARVREQTAVPA